MIHIVNTNENNLKGLTLTIPNNKLIVVTGVSGSGKSTLVNQVIYQEARRRYLESFSAGTRQLLGKAEQANFDFLSGLSPAIALEQKHKVTSERSTVGTLTEVYDLLRLLFARYGESNVNAESIIIDRNLFSFNSPKGACLKCGGIGVTDAIDKDLLISDATKTVREGVIKTTQANGYIMYSQVTIDVLNELCIAEGFSVDIPWNELTDSQKDIIWYGSNKIKVPFGKHTLESRMKWKGITAKPREEGHYRGMIPIMEEILKRDRNPSILRFTKSLICSECQGKRLNHGALSVLYNGYSIYDLAKLDIATLQAKIADFIIGTSSNGEILILQEVQKTTKLIIKLGLGFLNLTRPSGSLSGGETQRLRMAKLVNSGLRGMLYVFDEPSIGMHNTEVDSLLEVLFELRNKGNTVIVVEHNNLVIENSEWIIDLGPDAGKNGGEILFNGSIASFLQSKPKNSKTYKFLSENIRSISTKQNKPTHIKIKGINTSSIVDLNLNLVLNGINVFTGKSGVGKTSIIKDVLTKHYNLTLNGSNDLSASSISISGDESIKKLAIIDQSPIGKTPRSNPATYTGLSDELRNLFAKQPQAKINGLSKSHFSFNTKSGRCEKCEGAGYIQIGMHTLGILESICDACLGKQFQPNVLKVVYKEKNLADIYKMDIDEALAFFDEEKVIKHYLEILQSLGLGYLKLNQRSSTLSGGEARRVKLAKDLVKEKSQPTLYLIDEPSTGLHGHDVLVLIKSLQKLVQQGHTIVLSEQNNLFLQNADHIIELGKNKQGISNILFQGNYTDFKKIKPERNLTNVNNYKEEQLENFKRPISFTKVSTHNLKNIDVDFPSNKLTVVTGVSGSGKSSLIFDTLFAEGRQKYTECFSTYVRSRLNMNSEALYESATGLYPTIAVDQKNYAKGERSTVGTMMDVYAQLRLLFARVGKSNNNSEDVLSSLFSFNHEHGACTSCEGLGFTVDIDPEKLVSHPDLQISEGAMQATKPGKFYSDIHGQYYATLKSVAKENDIDLSKSWNKFTSIEKQIILFGTGDKTYSVIWEFKRKNREGTHGFSAKWPGFIYHVNEEYLRKINDKRAQAFEPLLKQQKCNTCNGSRLNAKALSYKIGDKNIDQLANLTTTELTLYFRELLQNGQQIDSDPLKQRAAFIIIGAIMRGLDVMEKLGLGYLSLNRRAKTLSGGEGQRVRLASSLVHDLSGVCFVLDEPTLGLHPKDTQNLMTQIKDLVGQGNTVVVSEHDPYFVSNADQVIELGPKAGKEGGKLVASGSLAEIMENKNTLSAKYYSLDFAFKREKLKINKTEGIKINAANANNLKDIDVSIPCNVLVGVKGVSGSGKSSLVRDVIYESSKNAQPENCNSIVGLDKFDEVVWVNQNTIKAGGQSYIASFLGFYDKLRKPFVALQQSKDLKLVAKHFSLNGKDGCCSECNGKGFISTALDFLSNVDEVCESCNGARYNSLVLSCKWNNLSIADVMALPLNELAKFYDDELIQKLSALSLKIGLGYVSSGQMLKTLSGGELQRVKLLQAILKSKKAHNLYLFDEPTMGLHLKDVENLLETFNMLLEDGHSIVFIEHNQHLLNVADYIIELGPGAGENGGEIIN